MPHARPRLQPFVAAALVLLAMAFLEYRLILDRNQGHFVYTLDDPYIHLALARNIAQGHYGINAGEVSAPSSSILWPFLLAPVASQPLAPLVINILASLLTLYVLSRLLATGLGATAPRPPWTDAVILISLVFTTNMVGLIFTGMEHSLQVSLVVLLVYGSLRTRDSGPAATPPSWLLAAIVIGPLIRFENAALSLAAILLLLALGHRRSALAAAALTALPLLAFSAFLHGHDLGLLPSSILAKQGWAARHGPSWLHNILDATATAPGLLLLMLAMVLGVLATARLAAGTRLLLVFTAVPVLAHVLFGKYGWYHRYEIYILVFVYACALYALNRKLDWLRRHGLGAHGVAIFVAGTLIIGAGYLQALATIPLASNNIHEQQYQMHRFATGWWRGPVAVNDLGWVSYGNEHHVLDLFGLGSREVLQLRADADADPNWPDILARRHDVGLAMIYDEVLPNGVPAHWVRLGELHLAGERITAFKASVSFFALDAASHDRARALLPNFRANLPEGVRFVTAP